MKFGFIFFYRQRPVEDFAVGLLSEKPSTAFLKTKFPSGSVIISEPRPLLRCASFRDENRNP